MTPFLIHGGTTLATVAHWCKRNHAIVRVSWSFDEMGQVTPRLLVEHWDTSHRLPPDPDWIPEMIREQDDGRDQ